MEEAGHAVLALAPVVEALVRGQPKQLMEFDGLEAFLKEGRFKVSWRFC